MRIAVIVDVFPAISSPFIVDDIVALMNDGNEVDVYAVSPGQGPVHPEVDSYHIWERIRWARPQGANAFAKAWNTVAGIASIVMRHPTKVLDLARDKHWRTVPATFRLSSLYSRAVSQNGAYDILHCYFGNLGYLALAFKDIADAKLMVSFFGPDDLFQRPGGPRLRLDRVFKEADLIVGNSNFTRQRLQQLNCPQDKLAVVPVGIDASAYTFHPKKLHAGETLQVLTVGRLVEMKGFDDIIRAVARVSEHRPVHLTIAGDGPERSRLESLVASLGMQRHVSLVGAVNRPGVQELLGRSHIYALGSFTGRSGEQDTAPMVLREAAASGLPIVATRTGGTPETVEHGASGILVPERDVDAFAEAIETLANQSQTWPEMGKRGREIVEERYDIRRIRPRRLSLYRTVISGNRPDPSEGQSRSHNRELVNG